MLGTRADLFLAQAISGKALRRPPKIALAVAMAIMIARSGNLPPAPWLPGSAAAPQIPLLCAPVKTLPQLRRWRAVCSTARISAASVRMRWTAPHHTIGGHAGSRSHSTMLRRYTGLNDVQSIPQLKTE
jgi:hypothetical protein